MKKRSIVKSGTFVLTVALLLGFIFTTNALSALQHAPQMTEPTPNQSYLFVQSASNAMIEIENREENRYTITLKNVSPYVTYFADRPRKNAGLMQIEQFLKLWASKESHSFKNDPPNADFSAVQLEFLGSTKMLNYALELTNPQYDSQSKTLTYSVKFLNTEDASIPTSIPLHTVNLFIDDACIGCW